MVPKKLKTRGVVVRLDPADHRRLKHLAADRDCTLLDLARKMILDGMIKVERARKPAPPDARRGGTAK
jgi:hypothetical protein